LEAGRSAAALNATSHIVWGERAFRENDADFKHTLLGGLLNAGAMLCWSAAYQLLPRANSTWVKTVKAAAVTASAYITDYHLVPKRLTPGFEERLSAKALTLVYASLFFGLLVGDRGFKHEPLGGRQNRH
jgi:hypothetical protein